MTLSIEEFGKQLLDTDDLDPIYVALAKLDWASSTTRRWLLSYWCWYDAGTACYHAESIDGHEYWRRMSAHAEKGVRGTERRYARARFAVRMIDELAQRYPSPETFVDYVADADDFKEVRARVREHYFFGDWIAFKIADMIDRLGVRPIHFSRDDVFLFKDPKKAAIVLWSERAGLPDGATIKDPKAAVKEVVDYLVGYFADRTAPPLHERPIDLQEVETILCKWKSHRNGRYPVGHDTIAIKASCDRVDVPFARQFREAMP